MSCEALRARLDEALLAHAAPSAEDAAHAESCAACGEHAAALRAVAAHLDSVQTPALKPAARAACEAGALRVLRAQRAARAPTPVRALRRDFLRAGAMALLVLPIALGHAWLVARLGSAVLGPVLPSLLLDWLAVFYFVPIALALGVLYGVIPLAVVAGRRRPLEES